MKVALMGAGRISKKMALTLNELKHPEIELYAIASRSQEKAQSFAQEFNIPIWRNYVTDEDHKIPC